MCHYFDICFSKKKEVTKSKLKDIVFREIH